MRTRRLPVAPPLFSGSSLDAIAPCDTTLNDTPKRVSGGTWSAAVSYSETLVTAGWSLFMIGVFDGYCILRRILRA